MNKPLSLIAGLLLLTAIAYSQDTTKKVQKATIPAAKPVYKPAPYQYRPAVAPAAAQPEVVDNSLNGQYNTVFKMAEHWQQAAVLAYHKSVTDTLNIERRKLHEANAKVAEQAKTIAGLQGTEGTKEQSLTDLQKKVNSISFLGIPMTKSAYNILMWGLVLILGGSLVAVIYLSGSNKREAAYRISEHEALSAEFAAYKAKANEKEKKLARELQTERNKVDELMGR
jgi:hypothetical protein